MNSQILVGTSGMSVWFSDDGGAKWRRPYSECGLYLEARVWALCTHLDRPDTVYAGSDHGLFRGDPKQREWTHLPSPMDGMAIWALDQAPHDPDVLVAGTHPAGLFRSDDGGASWRRLDCGFAESCMYIGQPRVTQVLFDPIDAQTIWAGVEIDGVHVSRDGGESWRKCADGLKSEDIHGLLAIRHGNGRRLFAATNAGLHVSDDDGANWAFNELDSPWQYTRCIAARADDPSVLFLGNGNGPPGSNGRLLISRDAGMTWRDAGLPGDLNSTLWCIATHPADPAQIHACTNLGQIFSSSDGGESWRRQDRELGEIRSVLWHPLG